MPVPPTDVARRIVAHYRRTKRDLPWRKTSDAYAIWVSEIMLQQTRVATVVPHFERWLERFPSVEALADAGRSSPTRAATTAFAGSRWSASTSAHWRRARRASPGIS